MIVTLTKKGFHSFQRGLSPLEIFHLFLLYEMVPTTAENTTLTSNNLPTIIYRWTTRARTCACIIWQERNEETREERMTGSVLRTKGTRNLCVPSIFHVQPCNKKIYTSLEKMGCRRCDVWILVQCRAAGGMHEEETWRRAAPENESPIIVRTPWIVARRWRANNDPIIDRPFSRPANF